MSTFAAGVLARLLFVFPVLWLLSVTGFAFSRCLPPWIGARQCLELVLVVPVLAPFVPIKIHDRELPLALPHLAIFLVAVVIAIAWQWLSSPRRLPR